MQTDNRGDAKSEGQEGKTAHGDRLDKPVALRLNDVAVHFPDAVDEVAVCTAPSVSSMYSAKSWKTDLCATKMVGPVRKTSILPTSVSWNNDGRASGMILTMNTAGVLLMLIGLA